MSTSTITESQYSEALRNLFFTRTIVQLLWAGIVLIEAPNRADLAMVMLLLNPLWDVACTVSISKRLLARMFLIAKF